MVACAVAIPDINQALKGTNGRLFPARPAAAAAAASATSIRCGCCCSASTRAYRGLGLFPLLLVRTGTGSCRARRYRRAEFSWVLEDNRDINQPAETGRRAALQDLSHLREGARERERIAVTGAQRLHRPARRRRISPRAAIDVDAVRAAVRPRVARGASARRRRGRPSRRRRVGACASRTSPANVDGTRAVAEAARDAGVPAGPHLEPGRRRPAPPRAPRSEDDPPAPINAYGRSKLEGEHAVAAIAGLRWTMLRPGVVYGPGDRALLPLFRAGAARRPAAGRPRAAPPTPSSTSHDPSGDRRGGRPRARPATRSFVGHPRPVTPRELLEDDPRRRRRAAPRSSRFRCALTPRSRPTPATLARRASAASTPAYDRTARRFAAELDRLRKASSSPRIDRLRERAADVVARKSRC